MLKVTTFATKWQKLAYYTKYIRISWTILYRIYKLGRHISGTINLTFIW